MNRQNNQSGGGKRIIVPRIEGESFEDYKLRCAEKLQDYLPIMPQPPQKGDDQLQVMKSLNEYLDSIFPVNKELGGEED